MKSTTHGIASILAASIFVVAALTSCTSAPVPLATATASSSLATPSPTEIAAGRWQITAQGIGPQLLGDPYIGGALEDEWCSDSPAAFVFVYGSNSDDGATTTNDYLFVIANESSSEDPTEPPITGSGITLGTPESLLVDAGYAKQTSAYADDYFDYSWREDGVPFVAGVHDGHVWIIGVGTDRTPLLECS